MASLIKSRVPSQESAEYQQQHQHQHQQQQLHQHQQYQQQPQLQHQQYQQQQPQSQQHCPFQPSYPDSNKERTGSVVDSPSRCSTGDGGGSGDMFSRDGEMVELKEQRNFGNSGPYGIGTSNYFSQVIRVSWNIIEAEIIANDKFQLGQDIEKFYELNQQLTMDDLARKKFTHTQVCLVRVLGRVVRSLEEPESLENYLRCIGRLHQMAGVDINFLAISGKAFCLALDSIEHHRELWSPQVKATWNLLFIMIVRMMKGGYAESVYRKLTAISFEHRSLIAEVWSVLQENAVKYVSNTMFLPLIVRSNKSLQKYFTTFDQALQGMDITELYSPNFDRTKHGSLFLSKVLVRVLPHLEQLEVVVPYLQELGQLHQRHGVRRHHIDLVGLAYCCAIRGVVQGGGVKGGPLHDTTKAWICLIQAICRGIKLGYTAQDGEEGAEPDQQVQDFQGNSPAECTRTWRRSLRSGSEGSCRLLEKRRGVTYFEGALEDDLARASRRLKARRTRNKLGSCLGLA